MIKEPYTRVRGLWQPPRGAIFSCSIATRARPQKCESTGGGAVAEVSRWPQSPERIPSMVSRMQASVYAPRAGLATMVVEVQGRATWVRRCVRK